MGTEPLIVSRPDTACDSLKLTADRQGVRSIDEPEVDTDMA